MSEVIVEVLKDGTVRVRNAGAGREAVLKIAALLGEVDPAAVEEHLPHMHVHMEMGEEQGESDVQHVGGHS